MRGRRAATGAAAAVAVGLLIIASQALAQGAPVQPLRPPPTPELFLASADASTYSNHPSTNYGAAESLGVGNNAGSLMVDARAYLAFDISEIPTGAEIVSAMLELYVFDATGPGPFSIRVHGVDEAWEEGTIDWSNQPDPGTLHDTQSITGVDGYKSWDVTALVPAWLGKFRINNGLVLVPGSKAAFGVSFRSSEALANRPRLVISYLAPTPTRTRTPTPTVTPTNTRGILRPTATATGKIPVRPSPTPTRSLVKPPTSTRTRTATATRTPPDSATPTETPTPHRLYLPLVIKQFPL